MLASERPSAQSATHNYGELIRSPSIDPKTLQPECYMLHEQATRCLCCARAHHSSRLFILMRHRPTSAFTLVPATADQPLNRDLPITHIKLKPLFQHFCHACILNQVREGRSPDYYSSETEWRATLKRKAEQRIAAVREAAPPRLKIEPSISDL